MAPLPLLQQPLLQQPLLQQPLLLPASSKSTITQAMMQARMPTRMQTRMPTRRQTPPKSPRPRCQLTLVHPPSPSIRLILTLSLAAATIATTTWSSSSFAESLAILPPTSSSPLQITQITQKITRITAISPLTSSSSTSSSSGINGGIAGTGISRGRYDDANADLLTSSYSRNARCRSKLFLQISRGGGVGGLSGGRGSPMESPVQLPSDSLLASTQSEAAATERDEENVIIGSSDHHDAPLSNSDDVESRAINDTRFDNNGNNDVTTRDATHQNELAMSDMPSNEDFVSMWPQFDKLDQTLMKIAIPCIANFAINPLIGAVDLLWVNRMGDALAVAGQAAANQVFTSAFWVISFLPSVTATLVSKANAQDDQEELQDAVSQSLVVGFWVSLIGSALMLRFPEKVLQSVLKDGAPALQYAKPYLFIRSFAFLPSLISLIGFSAFRGTLDTSTPLKISAASNIFNAILDPILMFTLAMGVPGAALATLAAEIISAASFVFLMLRRNLFRWSKIFRLPSWSKLRPLLQGGAALQLRNVALNVMFLAVARVTQSLDDTGVAAAAHALAIQTFQVGGIVLLALSVVAQTVVPNELVEKVDLKTGKRHGGKVAAKNIVNRLMSWGFVLGIVLGTLQLVLLPVLQKSSPLEEVKRAAVSPSILASVYQVMNGMVFIGEGVMIGCGSFMQLSLGTIASTAAAVFSLSALPKMFGLTGVWMSFGVFNVCRLAAVWLHQTRIGPLATKTMTKEKAS